MNFLSIIMIPLVSLVKMIISLMMIFPASYANADMKTDRDWTNQAKGLLKAELKRRNVSYSQLSAVLKGVGVAESPENIANKISRGKFTTVFFLQCLEAIGCRDLRIDD
jgi:hypothetical protein